ncbi:MAG: AraC family transcriptional regulator [Hydrogenophaga sp.]|uniref:helix-turn-helix domain-containing protein n=1 Tax=Hydrogenophaga sp. TaxID=1904254 RepID=UPI00262D9877|nr:AraC family transcriptional regulator [Hydrogenophaga sp.]MCV0440586.1 AraC family transcriptional regulator [Hydrogenophaga sp.]
MTLQRLPTPALRPFVARLWASDDPETADRAAPVREHLLPTGAMHVVLRLTDSPLYIVDPLCGPDALALDHALVGGARSRFYVRELSTPACSVGAVLHPGVAGCLFGVAADGLAGRHTPLEALWGASAQQLRERLRDTAGAEARLGVLEAALLARLPRVRGLHPAIAAALAQLSCGRTVAAAVQDSGYSHRRFVALFRQDVGLGPKSWQRVQRFQRALPVLAAPGDEAPSLAALAADAGYSDQSHFNRDFLAFAGVTPLAYRARAGMDVNHLRIGGDATARHG